MTFVLQKYYLLSGQIMPWQLTILFLTINILLFWKKQQIHLYPLTRIFSLHFKTAMISFMPMVVGYQIILWNNHILKILRPRKSIQFFHTFATKKRLAKHKSTNSRQLFFLIWQEWILRKTGPNSSILVLCTT